MKYKYADWFKELSIRMDQSSKDGRTIVSTASMSHFLKELGKFAEEVEQVDLRLKFLESKDRK